jgi:hypothetical protein
VKALAGQVCSRSCRRWSQRFDLVEKGPESELLKIVDVCASSQDFQSASHAIVDCYLSVMISGGTNHRD